MSGISLSPATESVSARYARVRAFSERLCETLEPEDFVIQSMTDCSPIRWHLAHTTWFFETFVLCEFAQGYQLYDPRYPYLFNSYYIQAGARFDRPRRGLLSRPTVRDIFAYRSHVDGAMARFLEAASGAVLKEVAPVLEIGLNHEQQHQELMLTDVKHMLAQNPLNPVFRESPEASGASVSRPQDWLHFDAGIHEIGTDDAQPPVTNGRAAFSYDNEGPRHRVFLEAFELAGGLVTNGEFLHFVDAGGYRNPLVWMSEGWAKVESEGWSKPLYWERHDDGWREFTLSGVRSLDPEAPVCHLSFFEADAFARWSGARLPTEFEWEVAAQGVLASHGEISGPQVGNFVERGLLHPARSGRGDLPYQLFGDVWEWTSSSYGPYPGYAPPDGALGEYNGKFMCNQYVLRGGSCATSWTHIRPTYRNFFPAHARWQFSGLRLARSL